MKAICLNANRIYRLKQQMEVMLCGFQASGTFLQKIGNTFINKEIVA